MISDHRYGRLAETVAAWALRMRGYRIVGRNLRVAGREVDLVARRGGLLVVCEVKARRSRRFGAPVSAVDRRRQQRLREAASVLASRDRSIERVRVDVIAIEGVSVRHLPGALPAV